METSCPDSVHLGRRATQISVTRTPAKLKDPGAPRTRVSLVSEERNSDMGAKFD